MAICPAWPFYDLNNYVCDIHPPSHPQTEFLSPTLNVSPPPLHWDDDFLARATVDDLHRIPEELIYTLDFEKMEDIDALLTVIDARLLQSQRMEREELGLPPAPSKSVFKKRVDPIVQVVQERGWDDFGYFLYRTSYGDDVRYDRWFKEFDKMLDASLERSKGGATILDRLLTPHCDNPEMKDVSLAELIAEHRGQAEGNPWGDGVLANALLKVDDEAMSSLLEPDATTPPWVWMVDTEFEPLDDHGEDTETHDKEDNWGVDDPEYRGYFKVAIETLLTEMFPLQADMVMSTYELWAAEPTSEEHPVWPSWLKLS